MRHARGDNYGGQAVRADAQTHTSAPRRHDAARGHAGIITMGRPCGRNELRPYKADAQTHTSAPRRHDAARRARGDNYDGQAVRAQ
jgi:hypothetical protein